MKKNFLFVAMLFATLSLGFVGCEKSDDLLENGNEDMDISINSDSIVDNLLQDIDPNGNVVDSKPTAPALPELIATGGSSDTWYSSVTLWGRLNPDKFTSIKEWGIECSTSKQELLSHKATKKSSVAGFVGENNDEFFVFFRGVGNGKKLYYNAYVQTNDMQYVYGNIDSVQMLVKLTVESNNTSYGTVKGSDYYKVGEEVTITATPSRGYTFVKWNDGNTDNPRIITAEKTDITYTANFELFVSGTEKGFGYIDLGLPSGLKWATCNVGATSPREYGDYFAWGEVEPKEAYNWGTYKWCIAEESDWYNEITKYNYYDEWSDTGDGKTVLDPEDDAAAVNMGGSWRMPTQEELQELIDECTWKWDFSGYDGDSGYYVEGPNGNSIFLPAAGYRGSSDLDYAGSYGIYWSSSLDTYDSGLAYNLYFNSGDVCWSSGYRYGGQSVRGVFSH